MKRITLAGLVFMLMFVCAGLGFAQEKNVAEKTTQQTAEPAKKVYVIFVNEVRLSTTYILEDVEAAEFNGVKCLKGKQVDISWVANKTVYIPVDKISVIVEYDSLSQYKENVAKYQKIQMENQ